MKIRRDGMRPFCYWVESRSRPGHEHYVNWLEESCSCEQYAFNNRKWMMAHPRPFVCEHMDGCREMEWNEIVDHSRDQLLKE